MGGISDRLGEYLLSEKTFTGLRSFFQRAARSDYEYKVAMAPRCFNLCEAILDTSAPVALKNIISNQGLLIYANEFASCYLKHYEFPSVLLIDVLLTHGKTISTFLYCFENAVAECLHEQSGKWWPISLVHLSLMEALEIWVYASVPECHPVEKSYMSLVKSEIQLTEQEIIHLSQQLSLFLNESGVANTTFQLTVPGTNVLKRAGREKKTDWEYLNLDYHGFTGKFYFPKVSSNRLRMVSAAYFYHEHEGLSPSYLLTGMIYFRTNPMSTIENALEEILEDIQVEDCVKLAKLLKKKTEYNIDFRMQFIGLLFSAYTIRAFIDEDGNDENWGKIIKNSDLLKVARYFGKYRDTYALIHRLVSSGSIYRTVKNWFSMTEKAITPTEPFSNEISKENFKKITEDIICLRGVQSELDAYEYSVNRKAFRPLDADKTALRFDQYIKELKAYQFYPPRFSIAAAMNMERAGMFSVQYIIHQDLDAILCQFKTEEPSTYIIPERYRDLLPALIFVEKRGWMIGLSPQSAVIKFVSYLQKHIKQIPSDDLLLVLDMQKALEEYLRLSYAMGKRLRQWEDFDWKSLAEIVMNTDEYRNYMDARGEKYIKYIKLASKFIIAGKANRLEE